MGGGGGAIATPLMPRLHGPVAYNLCLNVNQKNQTQVLNAGF